MSILGGGFDGIYEPTGVDGDAGAKGRGMFILRYACCLSYFATESANWGSVLLIGWRVGAQGVRQQTCIRRFPIMFPKASSAAVNRLGRDGGFAGRNNFPS